MNKIDMFAKEFRSGRGNSLELIFKISERCNLICTYCYFFFGGDESYKKHPPVVSDDVVLDLGRFIESSIDKYKLDSVRVILHGGEPLLLNKSRMKRLLEVFSASGRNTKMEFTIQTNAVLLDEQWIELFHKYDVYVGVSLDGPPEVNDIYRIDKNGKGTYQKTLNGINLLFDAYHNKKIQKPGLLCVINPKYSASVNYDHFINELGFENVDFLLPDDNHDSFDLIKSQLFTRYLLDLFNKYKQETKPKVEIRLFNKLLREFLSEGYFKSVLQNFYKRKHIVLSVASNGDISPDDILRTTDPKLMELGLNVADSDLLDVVTNEKLFSLVQQSMSAPAACEGCDWLHICKGGDLYHRYSRSNGFANRSIYCESLKALCNEMAEMLLQTDYDEQLLLSAIECRTEV